MSERQVIADGGHSESSGDLPRNLLTLAASAIQVVVSNAFRASSATTPAERAAMILFRGLLVVILAALSVYTAIVISTHGWNLLAVFIEDMAELKWPGQFNLDFMGFLTLSAIWTAWRHRFSPGGLALGVVAFFGGMMFLTIYLLVASYQVKGDVKALLLGRSRARADALSGP